MSENWADERPKPGAANSYQVSYPEPLGTFLNNQIHDDLMHIVIELAAESWVTKRRLRRLEALLTEAGTIESLDKEHGEKGIHAEDTPERDAFIERIFGQILVYAESSEQDK